MDEQRLRRLVLLIVPLLVLLMIGGIVLYRTWAVARLDRKHDAQLSTATKSVENRPSQKASPEPESKPGPPPPPPPAPTAKTPATPAAPATRGIDGKIYLPDGRPAPRARVDLFVVDAANRHSRHTATTDDLGAFVFDLAPHSRMILTAHAPGFARSLTFVPDAEDVDGQLDFGMHLGREAVATGILEQPDGTPLAGATIRFHPFRVSSANTVDFIGGRLSDPAEEEPWWKELALTDGEATTSSTGEFRAPSLWSGIHYAVEILREGREVEVLPVQEGVGRKPIRLRLSR